MPEILTEALRPRFASIDEAIKYSGIGRSRLYEIARQHEGLLVKNGKASLVNLPKLDQVLDGLPPAKLKAPS